MLCLSLIRFPIPDLKVTQKPPWYQPSLHPEILYVSMEEVGVSAHTLHRVGVASHPLQREGHYIADFKFQSTKGKAILQEFLLILITPSLLEL